MQNTFNDRMSFPRLLAFSGTALTTSLVHGPVAGVLPTIIAKYYGVSLTTIATILLVSRIFDGITDPIIGYLSDRTSTRFGKRKPWILCGSALLLIAVYHLFIACENAGAVYFMVWFVLIALFWTIAEVPFWAWMVEITGDYNERTRIVTYRMIFLTLGGLLFAVSPALPMFKTGEMNPEVLRFVGWVIIGILPVLVAAQLIMNPEKKDLSIKKSVSLKDTYHAIKSNKPYHLFLIVNIATGLILGITNAMAFPILTSYMMIGDKYAQFYVPLILFSLFTLPLWPKIMEKIGKHRTVAMTCLISVVILPFFLFIKPGPGAFYPFLIWCLAFSFLGGASLIAPTAMLADVIDYDTLKTGVNRAGQYQAFLALVAKCNAAVGGAIGFFLMDLVGFDILGTNHGPYGILGVKIIYVGLPIVLSLGAAYVCWIFPIDEKKQAIIQKRLKTRADRMAVERK